MLNNPPSSRHARRRQQTRKLLIDTTLRLVIEKGFDAISIQDITDRADLGRGTFYIHFKDKEDVVWTAIQELVHSLEQQVHREFKEHPPQPVEYYGLLNIYRHTGQNRDLYRVIFGRQGSAALSGRMQDLLADILAYDLRMARESRERTFDVPDEFIVQMLTGVISRLVSWWLETPNNYTAEKMAAMSYEALYHKKAPESQ